MKLPLAFERRVLASHPTLARAAESMGFSLSDNDARIAALQNKHKGERCFIIATGPSLRVEDLDRLQKEVCFGCNKIFLAFDRTNWRPRYYTVLDVLVAEINAQAIRALRVTKIFPTCVKEYFPDDKDIIWTNSSGSETQFSEDLFHQVVGGYTVIYPQMQMAFFMGFSEVALLGLDFSFQKSPSTGEFCPHGEVLKSEGEINHFDPRYRPVGEKWTTPRLDLQYGYFKIAKERFERAGRRIINASRQTALDVFERVSFDDIVK